MSGMLIISCFFCCLPAQLFCFVLFEIDSRWTKLLRSPDFGQFSKVLVLKNAPSYVVLERLETLLHEAGREDLVLVYFSGHGKLNASGQLCLATANTKLRALGSTSIPVERIKSFFDAASTRKKILILDCCYSGAAGAEFVKGGVWTTSFSSCPAGREPSS